MNTYWRKRAKSFKYAWNGIRMLFGNEANAGIHLFVATLVVIFGFIFNLSPVEWCLIALCIVGVFMAEGMNTALEKICDKVSPEYNKLIGASKDIAAGAVLLYVIGAVIVGLIIFIPKVISIL